MTFEVRKREILDKLAVPEADYNDLSPKGSIDEAIKDLINDVNQSDGLVTTSSCAGRVSIFLEGRKEPAEASANGPSRPTAGPGGKGAGGDWLFVSHDPVPGGSDQLYKQVFGERSLKESSSATFGIDCSFVRFKFEPMILHVLTASSGHAQNVLTAALEAGFRESGAVSLAAPSAAAAMPVVAVRSSGLAFDSIVGYRDSSGTTIPLVDEAYFACVLAVANKRFVTNRQRIQRFQSALLRICSNKHTRTSTESTDSIWEPADTRRARKRAEGLQRQRERNEGEAQLELATHQDGEELAGIPGVFRN